MRRLARSPRRWLAARRVGVDRSAGTLPRHRWFPEGKVVFVAPSRPLVSQQLEACSRCMDIPKARARGAGEGGGVRLPHHARAGKAHTVRVGRVCTACACGGSPVLLPRLLRHHCTPFVPPRSLVPPSGAHRGAQGQARRRRQREQRPRRRVGCWPPVLHHAAGAVSQGGWMPCVRHVAACSEVQRSAHAPAAPPKRGATRSRVVCKFHMCCTSLPVVAVVFSCAPAVPTLADPAQRPQHWVLPPGADRVCGGG